MSTYAFDVLIVGAGPAGYSAAIRLAQLGKQVAVIDQYVHAPLGKANYVSSQFLVNVANTFFETTHSLMRMGINVDDVQLDLMRTLYTRNKVMQDLQEQSAASFHAQGITCFQGFARFVDSHTLMINDTQALSGESIIIATGSTPKIDIMFDVNEQDIITSKQALSLTEVPQHLVVVGGGYVGLEIGSLWRRLGAMVTIVEKNAALLGDVYDQDVTNTLKQSLEKMGIIFKCDTTVTGVTRHTTSHLCVHAQSTRAGPEEAPALILCDKVLIATGQKPAAMNHTDIGLPIDLTVNACYQTVIPHIYAIGDCLKGPMFAHKAMREGIAVAEFLSGQAPCVNYHLIPDVLHTYPTVAQVGLNENQLLQEKIPYTVHKIPYQQNTQAVITNQTTGFIKLLADPQTKRVIGCAIIGAEAASLINHVTAIMEFSGTTEDLWRTCQAHSTFNDIIQQAAYLFDD